MTNGAERAARLDLGERLGPAHGMPVISESWFGGSGTSIIVHGGAGERAMDSPAQVEGCRRAAEVGYGVLESGGTAMDAVEHAVVALEDDPLFNAGLGGALTELGTVELDASIIDARTLRAGAVCALSGFRNPIVVARAVLEEGRHVLYAGAGAADFARAQGIPETDPASLVTERARERLAKALAKMHLPTGGGTVGAVARDARGDMAAATSTGGISGKRSGRVGDSPVLGAGTYADLDAGAASATGQGEGILRVLLSARALDALRLGYPPDRAAAHALEMMHARVGALGGLVLVDQQGQLGLARSTESMSWAARWGANASASGD